jgi:hypothetical protein
MTKVKTHAKDTSRVISNDEECKGLYCQKRNSFMEVLQNILSKEAFWVFSKGLTGKEASLQLFWEKLIIPKSLEGLP